jgi:hypothetical protein
MKRLFAVLAIVVLVIASLSLLLSAINTQKNSAQQRQQAYVGITYCENSVADGKLLIDKVKNCTNLFVLQSGSLQRDLKSVEELGDYAVSSGLAFLPYFGVYIPPSFSVWLENVTHRWGTHFLGVYYCDEPGGKMLDDYVTFTYAQTGDSIMKTRYGDIVVEKPDGVVVHYEIGGNINLFQPATVADSASDSYIKNVTGIDIYATFYSNGTINVTEPNVSNATLENVPDVRSSVNYEELMQLRPLKDTNEISQRFYGSNEGNIKLLSNLTKTFTSDYAVYWFDYLAGYDVVLAQLGWNNSFTQNIALARGAANIQNKEWGVILTWKYDSLPYLDSGDEIYNQMRTAYDCGAKYLILFNYYENDANPYGTMKDEHFLALQKFWNTVIQNNSEICGSVKAQAVLVLPKNYASGMRWADDRVWGILEPDQNSPRIWDSLQKALASKGLQLDIVYDDSTFPLTGKYSEIIPWNQTNGH